MPARRGRRAVCEDAFAGVAARDQSSRFRTPGRPPAPPRGPAPRRSARGGSGPAAGCRGTRRPPGRSSRRARRRRWPAAPARPSAPGPRRCGPPRAAPTPPRTTARRTPPPPSPRPCSGTAGGRRRARRAGRRSSTTCAGRRRSRCRRAAGSRCRARPCPGTRRTRRAARTSSARAPTARSARPRPPSAPGRRGSAPSAPGGTRTAAPASSRAWTTCSAPGAPAPTARRRGGATRRTPGPPSRPAAGRCRRRGRGRGRRRAGPCRTRRRTPTAAAGRPPRCRRRPARSRASPGPRGAPPARAARPSRRVEDLHLRPVPVDGVQQPADRGLGLLADPEPEQRLERVGGVADPGEAVVPVLAPVPMRLSGSDVVAAAAIDPLGPCSSSLSSSALRATSSAHGPGARNWPDQRCHASTVRSSRASTSRGVDRCSGSDSDAVTPTRCRDPGAVRNVPRTAWSVTSVSTSPSSRTASVTSWTRRTVPCTVSWAQGDAEFRHVPGATAKRMAPGPRRPRRGGRARSTAGGRRRRC